MSAEGILSTGWHEADVQMKQNKHKTTPETCCCVLVFCEDLLLL